MAFDPLTTNWQDLETPIGRAADRSVEDLRRQVVRFEVALGNISLIVRNAYLATPSDAPIIADLRDIRAIVDEALRTPEVPG
jgi:hypothetical protein